MPNAGPPPSPPLARHLPLFVLLAACLGLGVSRTAGLAWPHDADLYRNMAQAQTMVDGDWFADPFYRGEKAWYNPLTPAVIAVLHRITGIAIPRLYAQAGAVFNLAVPAAFYVLAHATSGGSRPSSPPCMSSSSATRARRAG